MKSLTLTTLRECASEVGLAVIAVTDAQDLELDRERLTAWQHNDYAGDMSFMNREPSLISSPRRLLPSARSVVSVGAYYDRSPRVPLELGYGRIARYAWGRDYHKVLRKRLEGLCEVITGRLGLVPTYRVFSDSVPLLERAVARKAGIGFIGKNTMLITPRAGSFMFLGEILWDLEVEDVDAAQSARSGSCGSCSRCLDQCPSQAFVSERVLDARRCISYLTIEKRGALSWQERAWIGDWVFGCDVCQEVCPFNTRSLRLKSRPDVVEFSSDYGVGQVISLQEVLNIRDDASFVARFGGTPIMRAKRAGLLRNAAVVAANTGVVELIEVLAESALNDSAQLVRQHAVWAYCVLARLSGVSKEIQGRILNHASADPDAEVASETRNCLEKLL
jgi:epoxyqueuosine reductase